MWKPRISSSKRWATRQTVQVFSGSDYQPFQDDNDPGFDEGLSSELGAGGDHGGDLYGAVKDRLLKLFSSNSLCAALLGGQAIADKLLNKMDIINTASSGWTPQSSSDKAAVFALSNGQYGSTTWPKSNNGTQWSGGPYKTYVGTLFNGYNPAQQETALIHEMSHPYSNSATIPDSPNSETSNANIVAKCGTELPTK